MDFVDMSYWLCPSPIMVTPAPVHAENVPRVRPNHPKCGNLSTETLKNSEASLALYSYYYYYYYLSITPINDNQAD